jgi:hypothetical protein
MAQNTTKKSDIEGRFGQRRVAAFCAYEWTSTPDNRNMHRNVFFKDCANVPDNSGDTPRTFGANPNGNSPLPMA